MPESSLFPFTSRYHQVARESRVNQLSIVHGTLDIAHRAILGLVEQTLVQHLFNFNPESNKDLSQVNLNANYFY